MEKNWSKEEKVISLLIPPLFFRVVKRKNEIGYIQRKPNNMLGEITRSSQGLAEMV